MERIEKATAPIYPPIALSNVTEMSIVAGLQAVNIFAVMRVLDWEHDQHVLAKRQAQDEQCFLWWFGAFALLARLRGSLRKPTPLQRVPTRAQVSFQVPTRTPTRADVQFKC